MENIFCLESHIHLCSRHTSAIPAYVIKTCVTWHAISGTRYWGFVSPKLHVSTYRNQQLCWWFHYARMGNLGTKKTIKHHYPSTLISEKIKVTIVALYFLFWISYYSIVCPTLIARFMGPTWGPSGGTVFWETRSIPGCLYLAPYTIRPSVAMTLIIQAYFCTSWGWDSTICYM